MLTMKYTEASKTLKLQISGRFEGSLFREFIVEWKKVENQEIKSILMDMRKLEFIDSSGMGQLLIIREKTKLKKEDIEIINVPSDIIEGLKEAHFEQIFTFR